MSNKELNDIKENISLLQHWDNGYRRLKGRFYILNSDKKYLLNKINLIKFNDYDSPESFSTRDDFELQFKAFKKCTSE